MSQCVRLLTTNYVDVDVLANYDVSSEQSAFPVLNAFNQKRRSKVWRSNGHYDVVSGSNTIVFRDDASTNITATVTAGSYTSTSAFMTAVDTALEAVGAANYTVTQDSNLKFVITSDLSGGATAFKLMWTHANSAGMAALMGFDTATDDTGASTYTSDILRIHSSEWILFDMGISSNPDSFVMIGPRNSPIRISPGATIKLQGNETNDFTTPSYTTTLTYDDEAIIKLEDTGFHTEALRYWRIYFEDKDNANGYVEIGAFFLGEFYAPSIGSAQFPLQSTFIDRSTTVTSEGGQTFADIRDQTQSYQIEWLFLNKTEIEDLTEIFRDYGTASPFFISIDTDAIFSSSANRRVKFVKFSEAPSYELQSPNLFRMVMNLREEL